MDDQDWEITIGKTHEKGKQSVPIKVTIPANQKWMYYMLREQQSTLKAINSSVGIVAGIVLLMAILAGCGALGFHL